MGSPVGDLSWCLFIEKCTYEPFAREYYACQYPGSRFRERGTKVEGMTCK